MLVYVECLSRFFTKPLDDVLQQAEYQITDGRFLCEFARNWGILNRV
jgi:hypothetical protein